MRPPPSAPPAAQVAPKEDPWPECAAVREYLRDHNGEPDSVQVVKWEGRDVWKTSAGAVPAGAIEIRLLWRGKNEFGAMSARRATMVFASGKPVIVSQGKPEDSSSFSPPAVGTAPASGR